MQFLDINGLKVFLNGLKNVIGHKSELDASVSDRRTYLLNIDYTELEFNTEWIVGNSSSALDEGLLDEMILM